MYFPAELNIIATGTYSGTISKLFEIFGDVKRLCKNTLKIVELLEKFQYYMLEMMEMSVLAIFCHLIGYFISFRSANC